MIVTLGGAGRSFNFCRHPSGTRKPSATSSQAKQLQLDFLGATSKYILNDDVQDTMARLQDLVGPADRLHHVLQSPPTTLEEYDQKFALFRESLPLKTPLPLHGDYFPKWVFRMSALACMRRCGVERVACAGISPPSFSLRCGVASLTCGPAATLLDLQSSFPDQTLHCQALDAEIPGLNALSWFPKLQYTGPLELFTMHMCFLGNQDVYRHPFEWLRENMPRIREMQRGMTIQNGHIPSLTLLLAAARET